jgi:hypothetical protein
MSSLDQTIPSDSVALFKTLETILGSGNITATQGEHLISMAATLPPELLKIFLEHYATVRQTVNNAQPNKKSSSLLMEIETRLTADLSKVLGIEDIKFVDKGELPKDANLVSIADLFMDEVSGSKMVDDWMIKWTKMIEDQAWIGVASEGPEKDGPATVQYCSANEIDSKVRGGGNRSEGEIIQNLVGILSLLGFMDRQYSQQLEDQRDTSGTTSEDDKNLSIPEQDTLPKWTDVIKPKTASAEEQALPLMASSRVDPNSSPRPTWVKKLQAEKDAQKDLGTQH